MARSKLDTPSPAEPLPIPPHLASTFYLWLWWASETNEGVFPLPAPVGTVSLWVNDRLTFRRPDDTRVSAVMSGDNPAAALESRAALRGGKSIHELNVGLRRDDREFMLSLKGFAVDYSGLRLPGVLAESAEEMCTDRMFLLEEVHLIVDALIRAFADLRLGSTWPDMARAIARWAGAEPDTDDGDTGDDGGDGY